MKITYTGTRVEFAAMLGLDVKSMVDAGIDTDAKLVENVKTQIEEENRMIGINNTQCEVHVVEEAS